MNRKAVGEKGLPGDSGGGAVRVAPHSAGGRCGLCWVCWVDWPQQTEVISSLSESSHVGGLVLLFYIQALSSHLSTFQTRLDARAHDLVSRPRHFSWCMWTDGPGSRGRSCTPAPRGVPAPARPTHSRLTGCLSRPVCQLCSAHCGPECPRAEGHTESSAEMSPCPALPPAPKAAPELLGSLSQKFLSPIRPLALTQPGC